MTEFNFKKLHRLFTRLDDQGPLAIAVSGGGDSMALLHLALNWRGSPQGLVALTVDHGLRMGSEREAGQVKRWCNDLGVEHHSLKWHHGPITSGLQAKARAARYDLMSNWCLKHGVAILLTAHTAEDQAETVTMRLKRSSSPRSLAAIWPETKWQKLRVLRPLLKQKRKALRDYLTTMQQEWIEDPSNVDEKFERVRIRQSKPDIALSQLAIAAQKQVLTTETKAREWCAKHLTLAPSGMISFTRLQFKKTGLEIADAILCHIITLAGGTVPAPARRRSFIDWLQAESATLKQPRRTLGGAIFARRKNQIIAAREPGRIDAKPIPLTGGKPAIWDKRFRVRGPRGSSIVPAFNYKTLKKDSKIPKFVSDGWPLVIREDSLLATPLACFHSSAKITFIRN